VALNGVIHPLMGLESNISKKIKVSGVSVQVSGFSDLPS
jgi:hypothetical protein